MLSADNAHATHPNHPELSDPVNLVYMNEGVVIKFNANQKYTTDGVSEAVFHAICEHADVPVQHFANRSDMPGGSTLGNISGGHVSVNTLDIGLAQLAMHSSYETAGTKDVDYMIRAMRAFYETEIDCLRDGDYQLTFGRDGKGKKHFSPDRQIHPADMDKLVALCKERGFILPAPRSTAAWPTPGTTAPWAWNSKTTSSAPGGRSSSRRARTTWAGLRHPDEPRGVGGLRPRGRLQRPADGLQGLQGALPRRQAHRGGLTARKPATAGATRSWRPTSPSTTSSAPCAARRTLPASASST
ncbi:MAG: hypothetical protein V8Q82_04590 [Christensenellales bacterium]